MKVDRKQFFDGVKARIDPTLNRSQVEGIDAILDNLENDASWSSPGSVTLQQAAYSLATIFHETAGTFQPIHEYGTAAYFNKRYSPSTKVGKKIGNTKPGDGARYAGRGFVQLTGRANYRKFDIEDTPDDAMKPAIAFHILTEGMFNGSFTGKKFADYVNKRGTDYVNARRIINGTDRAGLIAGYATSFEKILRGSTTSAAASSDRTEGALSDESTGADTTSAVGAESPDSSQEQPPTSTETTKTVESGPDGTSASIEEKTTSFSPDTITQYIPKMKGVRNWFATLSLGGIASTTWAAFNGLPPWAIFVLGMVTMGVIIGFVFIVIRYRANLFDLVKHVISVNADPNLNNVLLTTEKE